MTPEDWKYVEGALHSPLSSVKLRCDDFIITLMVQPVKGLRNGIFVYINGKFASKWMRGGYEESKRFLRPHERALFTPTERKELRRIDKKCPARWDKKFTIFEPYWTNVTALRRHFSRNNTVIELVRDTPVTEAI
jgi:hypothetical protein